MRGIRPLLGLAAILGASVICRPGLATVILEYDAATAGAGVEPDDQGWTQFGTAMTNDGVKLLQDNTGVGGEQSGEYRSPALPAGTFTRGGADYGIEFRVKPLTDVQFLGGDWPQLYLGWGDDQFFYNVTIDKHAAGNTSGPGDIVYGQGSFSPAISGIDWSVPHSIFIGYRSGAVFDFYLDGVLQSTIVEGSIARAYQAFYDNRVDFGDGTTANADVAAEWYTVRVHDVNTIPEPASLTLVGAGLATILRRRR